MVRTALYLLAGLLLGLAIHLVVILTLPALASNGLGGRLAATAQLNRTTLLDKVKPGDANPLRLDPDLDYAVCRLDLRSGPGEVSGTLPLAFWSAAVFDQSGTVLYSVTNRDGIGQVIDIGIFNVAQTRLLAEQKIDIAANMLIVEAKSDDIYVVVRLAPPHPAMSERYRAQLARLNCRALKT